MFQVMLLTQSQVSATSTLRRSKEFYRQQFYRQQFQYFPLEGATPMTLLHMTIVVTVIALLILFIVAVLVIKQKW